MQTPSATPFKVTYAEEQSRARVCRSLVLPGARSIGKNGRTCSRSPTAGGNRLRPYVVWVRIPPGVLSGPIVQWSGRQAFTLLIGVRLSMGSLPLKLEANQMASGEPKVSVLYTYLNIWMSSR